MKNFKKLGFLAICSSTFLASCGMKTLTLSQAETWVHDHYHFFTELTSKEVSKISLNFSVSSDEKDESKPKTKSIADEVSEKIGRELDHKTSFSFDVNKDSITGKYFSGIAKVPLTPDKLESGIHGSDKVYTFTVNGNEISIACEGSGQIHILGERILDYTVTDIYNDHGQLRLSKLNSKFKESDINFTCKYTLVMEF